ncbi:dlpC [Symbiodinium sp. CCMP2592]|nr:dlpC [Symbiodinium sp. CCMP2592]
MSEINVSRGSVLWLARQKIVDNNGCHAAQEHRSASYNLRSGVYPLKVDMCEMSGGEVLKMTYRGPDTGGKKITVPKSALRLPGTLRIGTTG